MLLLVFADDSGAPPPPDARPHATRLGLTGTPWREYGTFPNRAPAVFLSLDPGSLAWTGQTLNAPVRLALAPGDLAWNGRGIPGTQVTALGTASVPGKPAGPFVPRTTPAQLILEPGVFLWTGQALVAPGDTITPADLAWTGLNLVIQTGRAQITALKPYAGPGRPYGPMVRTDGVRHLDVTALPWTGQALVIAVTLPLAPGDFTWTGQDIVTPGSLALDEFGLEPLEGVV